MRKLFAILSILLFMACTFALNVGSIEAGNTMASGWVTPVELSSTAYRLHNDISQWQDCGGYCNSNGFCDHQMIGSMKFTSMGSSAIKVSMVGGNSWFYVKDDGSRCPFGIEIHVAYRTKDGRKTGYLTAAELGRTSPAIRMGYIDSNSCRGPYEFTIPAETVGKYRDIWLDINLVLGSDVEDSYSVPAGSATVYANGIPYTMTPGTGYSSSLTITVNDSTTKTIGLSGQYMPDNIDNANLQVNVEVLNASSSGRSVVSLFDSDIQNVATLTVVGGNSIAGNYAHKKVYVFLSSSEEPSGVGMPFKLRLTNDEGQTVSDSSLNETNSIGFVAQIRGEGQSLSFDGTTTLGDTTKYFFVRGKYVGKDKNGTTNATTWNSSSTIGIKLDPSSVYRLQEGKYTSMIYVHVVTDL